MIISKYIRKFERKNNMDRKEIFRQILITLMNEGLLNEFITITFNYNLDNNDFIYAQYKIIDNNVILDIFDNMFPDNQTLFLPDDFELGVIRSE
jgi:hypothetical protein